MGAVCARFDTPSDVGIDPWQPRVAEGAKEWVERIINDSDRSDAQESRYFFEPNVSVVTRTTERDHHMAASPSLG